MTHAQPITDVVFDFCGVLIDWQCRAALDGHYPADLVDAIAADDDPYGFFRYEDDMDSGIAFAQVYPQVVAEQGQAIANIFAYYIEHYADALPRLIPDAEQLLRDLHTAGIRTWGLTNWSAETFHTAFEQFPQLNELLTDTVVSGVEQLRKPNADIYELAQQRFHLDPAHTVFFDDTMKNVQGAQQVGWHAFVFTTTQQARHDLSKLGVSLPDHSSTV